MSVATPRRLFDRQGRSERGGEHVSVRVPSDLLLRVANYGNSKGLTLAQTFRTLVELGLDNAR